MPDGDVAAVWPEPDRILDPAVGGEQTDPAVAIARSCGPATVAPWTTGPLVSWAYGCLPPQPGGGRLDPQTRAHWWLSAVPRAQPRGGTTMSNSSSGGPSGFDPEDLDRVVREAGEGLREALDGLGRFVGTSGERAGWSMLFDEFTRGTRPRTEPETTVRPATGCGPSSPSTPAAARRSSRCIPLSWMRCGRTRTTPIPPGGSGSFRTESRSASLIYPPSHPQIYPPTRTRSCSQPRTVDVGASCAVS